jgi:hypothetical protein
MSVGQSAIPSQPVAVSIQPVINSINPLTTAVTLTTPTSATLITGLTLPVTIPTGAQFIFLYLKAQDATVTAAATITLGAYQGVTTGALTTLFDSTIVVAPTGGTTVATDTKFILPVNTTMYGTTIFLSVAATASSGNFVMNAGSTSPINLVAVVY